MTTPKISKSRGRFFTAGLALATALVLLARPVWGQEVNSLVALVTAEVTDLDVLDHDTGEIQLEWGITSEDGRIEELRVGYCIRARVSSDYSWSESCGDEADATEDEVLVGKPYYCRPYGVEFGTQGQVRIKYLAGHDAETGNVYDYSPWSSTYTTTVRWYCSLSANSELKRIR